MVPTVLHLLVKFPTIKMIKMELHRVPSTHLFFISTKPNTKKHWYQKKFHGYSPRVGSYNIAIYLQKVPSSAGTQEQRPVFPSQQILYFKNPLSQFIPLLITPGCRCMH